MCYYSKGAEGESPQRLLLYLGEMVSAILRDMPGIYEPWPFGRKRQASGRLEELQGRRSGTALNQNHSWQT